MKTSDLKFALPLGMVSGIELGPNFRGNFGLSIGAATATSQETRGATFQHVKVGDIVASAVLYPLSSSGVRQRGEWQEMSKPESVGFVAVRNTPADKLAISRNYWQVGLADMFVKHSIADEHYSVPLQPQFTRLTTIALLATVLSPYQPNMQFTLANTYSTRARQTLATLGIDPLDRATNTRMCVGGFMEAVDNEFKKHGYTIDVRKSKKTHRPKTVGTWIVDRLEALNNME